MLSKHNIRRKFLMQRRLLTEQSVGESSKLVAEKILGLPDWKSARRVHIYDSNLSWRELDTVHLRDALKRRYPQLAIETSLSTVDAVLPTKAYDIIIVPVLGFDAAWYRLGLGKGWYDRFLATQPQAFTIGLAYSWAQVTILPHEPHDIPLDMIITEHEVLRP